MRSVGPKDFVRSDTDSAVRQFQSLTGLTSDGIVGPSTSSMLSTTVSYRNSGCLARGMKGSDVQQLQENLNSLLYNCGTPDGRFGSSTASAVAAYQSSKGISPANGVANAVTLAAIAAELSPPQIGNPSISISGGDLNPNGTYVTETTIVITSSCPGAHHLALYVNNNFISTKAGDTNIQFSYTLSTDGTYSIITKARNTPDQDDFGTMLTVSETKTVEAETSSQEDTTPLNWDGVPECFWTDGNKTEIKLDWGGKVSDNVSVTKYDIFMNGIKCKTGTTETMEEIIVTVPGGTYSFFVRAYDAANNHSDSPPVSPQGTGTIELSIISQTSDSISLGITNPTGKKLVISRNLQPYDTRHLSSTDTTVSLSDLVPGLYQFFIYSDDDVFEDQITTAIPEETSSFDTILLEDFEEAMQEMEFNKNYEFDGYDFSDIVVDDLASGLLAYVIAILDACAQASGWTACATAGSFLGGIGVVTGLISALQTLESQATLDRYGGAKFLIYNKSEQDTQIGPAGVDVTDTFVNESVLAVLDKDGNVIFTSGTGHVIVVRYGLAVEPGVPNPEDYYWDFTQDIYNEIETN